MKRLFMIVFFAAPVATFTCLAQTAPASSGEVKKVTKGPVITWEESTHDFGDVIQGTRLEKIFTFTNAGNQPLIITNVAVTCGCTTPKGWPKDPIPPNSGGKITIAFNSAGKYGKQNKVIRVVSNSVGDKNEVSFTANVVKKEQKN